jgi:cobalt/nickel transport system permease protein
LPAPALIAAREGQRGERAEGTIVHIPDGYLSPSTCALGYAVAAPFWAVALNRVKRLLQSRAAPLLAVISAFSFVIMMFNLPTPGGTTAHAVGMGVAAIVLGPWAAILAISIALMIQALFFGDGGVTAFGFNSFNMAIIGSFVSYGLYQLVAAGAPIASRRRVVAGGIAGYVAINMAALAAAIEFGVQPLLFHDATGAPLYAPYPLSISIPAMMSAHLTLAGAAEAIVTAGVVAFLQRSNPNLLETTALLADDRAGRTRSIESAGGWRRARALWAGLGALMAASPLGLLAAGGAWGEWRLVDLQNPLVREQIAHASGGMSLPAHAPQGLERLSRVWTAPMPDYAPSFMHNPNFGYVMSAITGAGLIVLAFTALSWFARNYRVARGQGG